jgi:hypothetical protein
MAGMRGNSGRMVSRVVFDDELETLWQHVFVPTGERRLELCEDECGERCADLIPFACLWAPRIHCFPTPSLAGLFASSRIAVRFSTAPSAVP